MLYNIMDILNYYWLVYFKRMRNFPGGPVVRTPCFQLQGVWVWSLVGELRSHILCGKKKKKNYFKKRMYFILREFHFKKTKCIAKERQVQSHHVRSDTKTAILTTQYSGTYSVQMSLNQEDFCCRLEEREAFYIRCGWGGGCPFTRKLSSEFPPTLVRLKE